MAELCCANCGFLGLRNAETGGLDEADERFRKELFIRGSSQRGTPYLHDPLPVCAKQKVKFRDETHPGNLEGLRRALDKDRTASCDEEFVKWCSGLTPTEHREMEMAARMKAWQEKQETENRRWQEAQAAAQRLREDSRDKASRDDQARGRYVQIGTAVFSVLAAASGWVYVTYFHDPPPPPPPPVYIQFPVDPKGEQK